MGTTRKLKRCLFALSPVVPCTAAVLLFLTLSWHSSNHTDFQQHSDAATRRAANDAKALGALKLVGQTGLTFSN